MRKAFTYNLRFTKQWVAVVWAAVLLYPNCLAQITPLIEKNLHILVLQAKPDIWKVEIYDASDSSLAERYTYDTLGYVVEQKSYLFGQVEYADYFEYKNGKLYKEIWTERNKVGRMTVDDRLFFFYPDSNSEWMFSSKKKHFDKYFDKYGFTPSDTSVLFKTYFRRGRCNGLLVDSYTGGKKTSRRVYDDKDKFRFYYFITDTFGNVYSLNKIELLDFRLQQNKDSVMVKNGYSHYEYIYNSAGNIIIEMDSSLFHDTRLWKVEYENQLISRIANINTKKKETSTFYLKYYFIKQ